MVMLTVLAWDAPADPTPVHRDMCVLALKMVNQDFAKRPALDTVCSVLRDQPMSPDIWVSRAAFPDVPFPDP
jgi:hypothetical protein